MPNPHDESPEQPGASKPRPPRAQSFNLGNIEHDLIKIALESREHPDERDARLRREEADAEHQRRIEGLIVRTILVTVSVAAAICFWIVLVPGQSAENAKWATTLLTTIVSGGLGYMTGKNSKSAS
jgi:hypothetical protein